jgi:L-ascorbate metabolism protein UlaG (beta-lactamase superfamily)
MTRRTSAIVIALVSLLLVRASAAGPSYVDITWMSISNMYYELGSLGIVTDGYFTRIPEKAFSGGGGGLAHTAQAFQPDVAAVTRVMRALGGAPKVNVLLTGHSHFDHSFDTPVWARLTGARIVGSRTTCLQVQALAVPAGRCQEVSGGEAIHFADGVTMRVVRWNHSGDSARNPEQHDPVELKTVPHLDRGGLHAGVADDFPNGGGNRGFLFIVDGPQGRFSWFFQNSASAVDLTQPINVDGTNFGAPLDNLRAAMRDAALESVDLWIGTGGAPVAQLVLPVLKPKAYLPVHWDGLYAPFEPGMPMPFSDPRLAATLTQAGVSLVEPKQYMDKWRLDRSGIHPRPNTAVKRRLGFSDVQRFAAAPR